MSGHSKWATIKRAKSKTDAARGKVFNRLIREITIAARMGGGDPSGNPRLRTAVTNARAQNMPGKNIENAILKGTGQLEGMTYEEFCLEGYGPGGVAVLVEAMSDNRNRTVGEVRHMFTRAGGNLGAANSVSWMFKSKGAIRVPKDATDEDTLMNLVLEAGADDMTVDEDGYDITTSLESFEPVKAAIENAGMKPMSAELTKISENLTKVEGDVAMRVLRLIDSLDEQDDVQHVYSNFDISEEDLARFSQDAK